MAEGRGWSVALEPQDAAAAEPVPVEEPGELDDDAPSFVPLDSFDPVPVDDSFDESDELDGAEDDEVADVEPRLSVL